MLAFSLFGYFQKGKTHIVPLTNLSGDFDQWHCLSTRKILVWGKANVFVVVYPRKQPFGLWFLQFIWLMPEINVFIADMVDSEI